MGMPVSASLLPDIVRFATGNSVADKPNRRSTDSGFVITRRI
jgi:hypothetical protein